jgi:hypothetical protein
VPYQLGLTVDRDHDDFLVGLLHEASCDLLHLWQAEGELLLIGI